MDDLNMIKRYFDEKGIGCVIRGDHVAINVLWVTRSFVGEERCLETTARVASLEEAHAALAACSLGRRPRPGLPKQDYNPRAID